MIINKNTTYLFFCVIPLISIIAFRGNTPDTQVYWNIFLNIHDYNLISPSIFYKETGVEIGFGWFSYILSIISANSFVFFFAYSLLIFLFILKTASKLKIPYGLFLLTYVSSSFFFIQQFMQIRQGLATAMVMYAIISMLQNKKNVFPIFILMASISIHQTALIFIAIFFSFLLYEKIIIYQKNKKTISYLLIALSIFGVKFILMPILVIISTRITSYTTIDQYSFSRSLFSLPNIRTTLVLLTVYLLSNKKLFSNKHYRFLFFCLVISFIFRIGFSDFAILNGRLSTVASFAEIFIIPIILTNRFKSTQRFFLITIIFIIQLYISLFWQSSILLKTYSMPLIN